MTCAECGGGVGQKNGQDSLELPTIESLPLTAPSDSCIVAANAQLHESVTLNIALFNGEAPSASASSIAPPAAASTTTRIRGTSRVNERVHADNGVTGTTELDRKRAVP